MIVLIFSTAFVTPLPRKRFLSPSRNSKASNSPVEAPLGAQPLPTVPSAKITSASTVGLPRESMISLPITFSIFVLLKIIYKTPLSFKYQIKFYLNNLNLMYLI